MKIPNSKEYLLMFLTIEAGISSSYFNEGLNVDQKIAICRKIINRNNNLRKLINHEEIK